MNLQDDTIQLLVDLVEKEQRRLDQFQPDSQDYARRFHALMDRFTDDQPLRKELLGLADLHGLINCRIVVFLRKKLLPQGWMCYERKRDPPPQRHLGFPSRTDPVQHDRLSPLLGSGVSPGPAVGLV